VPELEVTNANGCSHLPTLGAVYNITRVENMNFNCKKFFWQFKLFAASFVLHLCKKHLTAGFPLLCVTFTMTNLTKFFAIDVCNSHLQKSITRQQIQKQIQSHHD